MDSEYKINQFDFINVAIDCCAYLLLILLWLLAILFPLLFVGIYLYLGSEAGPYCLLITITSLLASCVFLMISKGLINRNRVIMFIVSVSSIYLAFKNISGFLLTDKTMMVKYVADHGLPMVEQLLIGLILFVSLFIRRLYKK